MTKRQMYPFISFFLQKKKLVQIIFKNSYDLNYSSFPVFLNLCPLNSSTHNMFAFLTSSSSSFQCFITQSKVGTVSKNLFFFLHFSNSYYLKKKQSIKWFTWTAFNIVKLYRRNNFTLLNRLPKYGGRNDASNVRCRSVIRYYSQQHRRYLLKLFFILTNKRTNERTNLFLFQFPRMINLIDTSSLQDDDTMTWLRDASLVIVLSLSLTISVASVT
jgi:hypothetical protein